MTTAIFPPKVAEFMRNHWPSESHRRMFILGQVMAKVAAMFQVAPGADIPVEATAVAVLMLEGLESGDVETYSRNDTQAMAIYNEWLAARVLQ